MSYKEDCPHFDRLNFHSYIFNPRGTKLTNFIEAYSDGCYQKRPVLLLLLCLMPYVVPVCFSLIFTMSFVGKVIRVTIGLKGK